MVLSRKVFNRWLPDLLTGADGKELSLWGCLIISKEMFGSSAFDVGELMEWGHMIWKGYARLISTNSLIEVLVEMNQQLLQGV